MTEEDIIGVRDALQATNPFVTRAITDGVEVIWFDLRKIRQV